MSKFLGWGTGADGDATPNGNINDFTSCSGDSSSKTLTVASAAAFGAGDRVLIHQTMGTGVANWEDNFVVSTGGGQLNLLNNMDNTYTDSGASQAQCVRMPQYKSATITGGGPDGWNRNVGGIYAAIISGVCTVSGTLNVDGATGDSNEEIAANGGNGDGFRGGGGNVDSTAFQGDGTVGIGAQSQAANGNGGGGGRDPGGINVGGGGGGGGNGTSGSAGSGDAVGAGGSTSGGADLTTMALGGGGGGGGNWQSEPGAVGGGSAGGGIVVIFAKTFIVSGNIHARGGAGGAGFSAGGGGAGGSVLIKAGSATLGSGLIVATGGAGGASGARAGGAGGTGRIRVEACSITGSTSPSASEDEGGQDWCGSVASIIGG